MVIIKQKFSIVISCLLIFAGCEKDPIFGLERGWILDGLGLDTSESENANIQFSAYDDGNVKVFEGITTIGVPVLDIDVQDGDIFEESLNKQKYTIRWKDSGNDIHSDSFELKKCSSVSLGRYGVSIYAGVCD